MNHYLIVTTCVVGLLMSACSTPQGPNEQGGMLLGGAGGALGGALIGSAIGNTKGALIGAGIGALAGGFAGKTIGKDTDQKAAAPQYREDPRYTRSSYDRGGYDRGHDRGYDRDPYRY